MRKIHINILNIVAIWIMVCIHLRATPIDSVFKKSAVNFSKFVSNTLNSKTKEKFYYFNANQVSPDGDFSYKEYINSSDNTNEIFNKNNESYKKAFEKIGNFNTDYDKDQFAFFVFHGRYFLGEKEYISKNYSPTFTGTNTEEKNRLKALQAAFDREKMGSVVNTDIEKLKASVKSEIEKVRNSKRIFVLFITEIYEVDYRKEKSLDEQNLPYKRAELYQSRYCFYETIGLQSLEKDILSQNFVVLSNQIASYENAVIDPHEYLYNATISYTSALWLSKVREQILSICESSKAFDLLKNVSPRTYELFSLEERVHLLVLIAASKAGEGREQMALNLLKTTPTDDIEELLQRLEHQKGTSSCNNAQLPNVLISCLMYRIDDSHFFIGNENYTELMTILTDLLKRGKDFNSRLNNLFSQEDFITRNIVWDPVLNVGVSKIFDFDFIENKAYVNYKVKELLKAEQVPINTPSPYAGTTFYTWNEGTPLKEPLRPFDLVLFTNAGNLDIINDALGNNTMQVVPAIFLQYAYQKNNVEFYKDAAITTICITIDVLTIWKGIPAFTAAKGLRRAWIGFELANSTGNLVLNLTGGELKDTKFADLVMYSDMIMLGLGVKDLTTMAVKSLPNIYSKVKSGFNNMNRLTLKYFFASYYRRANDITELVKNAENTSARSVERLYSSLKKDMERTSEGKKLLEEAEALARTGANLTNPMVDFLSKLPEMNYYGVDGIRGIKFKKTEDNIIDVIVHSNPDNTYRLWIDDLVVLDINEANLAEFISKNIPSDAKTIRLLSCSDLESAKNLSALLSNIEIHATDDIVRLHQDGGVTTIAKSGNATQKWRKLKKGVDEGDGVVPLIPDKKYNEAYIQMGWFTRDVKVEDLIKKLQNNYIPIDIYERKALEKLSQNELKDLDRLKREDLSKIRLKAREVLHQDLVTQIKNVVKNEDVADKLIKALSDSKIYPIINKFPSDAINALKNADDWFVAGNMSKAIEKLDAFQSLTSNSNFTIEQYMLMEDALSEINNITNPIYYRQTYPKIKLSTGSQEYSATEYDRLFHGYDYTEEQVQQFFLEGFPARGRQMKLDLHVRATGGVSAFMGATETLTKAADWADDGGYVFVITKTKGWDANKIYINNPMYGEAEITILAHIPSHKIEGAYKIKQIGNKYKPDGPFIPNPNFRP